MARYTLASVAHETGAIALSALDRHRIYKNCELSHEQAAAIEVMVAESPVRQVGRGALRNMCGNLRSAKNGSRRVFESHTVERLSLYELELDATVRGYYTQVRCTQVPHTNTSGRSHKRDATLDVLYFRERQIVLRECKTIEWLTKHSGRGGWECVDDRWTREPYARWAEDHGITFEVWTPPFPVAIYLRNMEAVYAALGTCLSSAEEKAATSAITLITAGPQTLEQLRARIPALSGRIVLSLLARGRVFGLLRSYAVTDDEQFALYADQQAAESEDLDCLSARAKYLSGMPGENHFGPASPAVLAHARKRLDRLTQIGLGCKPRTRRMDQLARKVKQAIENGATPLDACMPKWAACGHRSQLSDVQRECIQHVAQAWTSTDAPKTKQDAWFLLEDQCKTHKAPTPSITSLRKALCATDSARRALTNGGLRAYQGIAPRSDPRQWSGRAMLYGHTLHIDSSKRDVVCTPDLSSLIEERHNTHRSDGGTKDTFYLGIDEASKEVTSHVLVFGPSRIDAEAILIREHVHRTGMLPKVIIVDRGSENRSLWLEEFCERRGISLIYTMTAGSRSNSLAEFAIGQVNCRVSHKLSGSTEPDRAGRRVDARFKSRKTAKHDFLTISRLFRIFLYEKWLDIPGEDGDYPRQRKKMLVEQFGPGGTPTPLDQQLLVDTSRRWDGKFTANEHRGIRLANLFFTSEEVRLALRINKPTELRLDSVDPSVLWVLIGGRQLKAFHGTAQRMAAMPYEEQLWHRLIEPAVQRDNRASKLDVARKLHHKLQRAERAASTTKHLSPDAVKKAATDTPQLPSSPDINWSEIWKSTKPIGPSH